MKLSLAAAACGLFVATANAQVYLSELLVNPPGTDNSQEFVEIFGASNFSLSGYYLIIVEGDGTGAGVVDVVRDLSAATTGTNGLLLLRDAATPLFPAADPATTIVVQDFNPDIENGSNTYILGFGTPPTQGTDIDADNDGTIDGTPFTGFTVTDVVTILENDGAANVGYADDLGGFTAGPFPDPPASGHTPDALTRIFNADGTPCSWVGGDVTGTNPGGPYDYLFLPDGEVFGFDAHGVTAATVTPGSANLLPDSDADGVADGCDGCPSDSGKIEPGLCGCGIPEGCTFGRDIAEISATTGGTQNLYLYAGAQHAGKGYYVLGSVTGTSPGLPFNQSVLLPLNYDFYFQALLTYPNLLVLNSFATLDGSGNAVAQFVVPPALTLPFAITVNHAYLVLSPFNAPVMASNAVPVLLNP